MIYRLRHVTRYAYGGTVDLGAQMAHLTPRDLPGRQRVVRSEVTTDPVAAHRREGRDHFGNKVTWLFLDSPHAAFELRAEALVEVAFPPPPEPGATPPWESVATLCSSDPSAWQAAEFTLPSPLLPVHEEARDYARPSFAEGRPMLAALLDLNARIRRDFTFRAGVTTISTPVPEVLQRRMGVCQDFAQLMISALRSFGLPARYVSGYVRTRPPPGAPRRQGADQSHAWVGCWLGPRSGWVDLDPTNNLVVSDEHVVLGWGRDYADVSPIRGIVLGGGADHALSVGVDLEPV